MTTSEVWYPAWADAQAEFNFRHKGKGCHLVDPTTVSGRMKHLQLDKHKSNKSEVAGKRQTVCEAKVLLVLQCGSRHQTCRMMHPWLLLTSSEQRIGRLHVSCHAEGS